MPVLRVSTAALAEILATPRLNALVHSDSWAIDVNLKVTFNNCLLIFLFFLKVCSLSAYEPKAILISYLQLRYGL